MRSGTISFVSDCYEGSISDRRLVEVSGLLEKLEPGDELMADKGFPPCTTWCVFKYTAFFNLKCTNASG